MEAKDVWLLLASAVIGVVTSLIATFAAPPVGTAFAKLRSGFIERNKARALAGYALVWALRSGKWDKHLYALDSWGFILLWLLFFSVGSTVGLLTSDPSGRVVMMAVATISIVFAIRRMASLFLTTSRVRDFENYRAALLKRWPDIKLPE